uniref:Uncharacterized protein n=1 Tax=Alexandrium monilatum TaxID=311494 RepID=A0A7S4V9R3_9DINO|mmetsp:Transcript_71660/g.213871  ORF Transcript_71660/g.213871 Transcript_71660/m.213871 type:complete len:197 (-) Transcript_71660:112-702(-)
MSDDERGPKGKGKRTKGDGRQEGGGKKGGQKGGGGGGGPSVSRLKVVPKFIQEMQARLRPEEAKRGLDYAELKDKLTPLGTCDDDEYDVEAAQIVGSEFSLDTLRAFQSKRKAAEAPQAQPEESSGPMKFRGKAERGPPAGSGAGRAVSAGSGGGRLGAGPGRGEKTPPEGQSRHTDKAPPVKKRQRLSFDDDEGG